MYYFDEEGNRIEKCWKCHDRGWLLKLKPDGKPDLAHAVRCKCQCPIEPADNIQRAEPTQGALNLDESDKID